ncbi:hypothetical protein OF377_00255 [Ureaplasma sp. ES3154-GEN]|uniref:MSC_0621 family F1-like ATPase epsilon subunit n=1 Tax=Ureaplasma sp. ES3154-GEN TaxID=2984844 RepID=UPI0021E8B516|nr:hypothetical protein [Ureaplasma sp. ES3154-GEN]MCV3743320.1 hypothetical protein [Ureaplasma sp. ES3154-GEN]
MNNEQTLRTVIINTYDNAYVYADKVKIAVNMHNEDTWLPLQTNHVSSLKYATYKLSNKNNEDVIFHLWNGIVTVIENEIIINTTDDLIFYTSNKKLYLTNQKNQDNSDLQARMKLLMSQDKDKLTYMQELELAELGWKNYVSVINANLYLINKEE